MRDWGLYGVEGNAISLPQRQGDLRTLGNPCLRDGGNATSPPLRQGDPYAGESLSLR